MNTPPHLKSQRQDDAQMADQAAEWLDALENRTASADSFFAWLKESPRHVQEVLLHVSISDTLTHLSPKTRRDLLEQLAIDKTQRPGSVVDLAGESHTRRSAVYPRRPYRRMGAIAASVVLISTAVAGLIFSAFAPHTYSTRVGEQRALELDDGSIVHLNTQSRVSVRFNGHRREIHLVQGEALFNIKDDPSRPLFVRTPEAVIRVLGTQFNVYRRAAGTKVSVLDGLVQISAKQSVLDSDRATAAAPDAPRPTTAHARPTSTRLAAGEEANIAPNGFLDTRKPLEVGRAVAWRQRRLVFRSDSLADIATEFNRYNARVSIVIEGAAAAHRFSGTFDANAPQALAKALAEIVSLEVEQHPGTIVVRPRAAADVRAGVVQGVAAPGY